MTTSPADLAPAAACFRGDRFGPHNKDEGMHACPQVPWLLAVAALGAAITPAAYCAEVSCEILDSPVGAVQVPGKSSIARVSGDTPP